MSVKPLFIGSSAIDMERLAAIIVARGGPIVWSLRLWTCKEGQPPASRTGRTARQRS
jgi:hypothetical protein